MFKDSIYDDLDEISKLVEPFNCKFNEQIAKLPNEIILDFNFIKAHMLNSHYVTNSISLREVVKQQCTQSGAPLDLFNTINIKEWYKFELDEGSTLTIDLNKNTFNGELRVVKHKERYTDEELYSIILSNLQSRLRRAMSRPSNVQKSNIKLIDVQK